MKKIDREIMDLIAKKPRITLTEIGKKTETPVSTVFDRYRKIIKEYTLCGIWTGKHGKDQ